MCGWTGGLHCGSAGFSEPDEHGWMVPLPSAHVWVLTGMPVIEEQRRDPRYSLARWPAIEAVVRNHVA